MEKRLCSATTDPINTKIAKLEPSLCSKCVDLMQTNIAKINLGRSFRRSSEFARKSFTEILIIGVLSQF